MTMTPEDREAERIKSRAQSAYRAMDSAQWQEDYVRDLVAKHGEHPAFKAYMREMMLEGRLAEFLARPKVTRG